MNVNFKGYDCEIEFGRYGNGNIGMVLTEKETGQPVATATVNGDRINDDNEVGVKSWSENEGMVQTLVRDGVIDPVPVEIEPSGFVIIGYHRLTDKAIEAKNKAFEEAN